MKSLKNRGIKRKNNNYRNEIKNYKTIEKRKLQLTPRTTKLHGKYQQFTILRRNVNQMRKKPKKKK